MKSRIPIISPKDQTYNMKKDKSTTILKPEYAEKVGLSCPYHGSKNIHYEGRSYYCMADTTNPKDPRNSVNFDKCYYHIEKLKKRKHKPVCDCGEPTLQNESVCQKCKDKNRIEYYNKHKDRIKQQKKASIERKRNGYGKEKNS